ncbi:hypothetical protein GCM10027034_30970 [Ramlibacter solisilvae]|uniref:Uncharacterized protein n=1 Tax=Ramlibacter tataouinensis TaxID=94132 RepID=A0A127JRZ1_9BURK|nr:hypothetical protein [Ramlibacter tataouinensis]AMO22653.1 hypothetical protein UC35_06860 [Ramlibacter tataouinensis]
MQVARKAHITIALALAFGAAMASEDNAALIQAQSGAVIQPLLAHATDATMLKPLPPPPKPYPLPYPRPRPPIPPTFPY